MLWRSWIGCALVVLGGGSVCAQIKTAEPDTVVRYGDTLVTRYQIGVSITANRGAARAMTFAVVTPLECPEQTVQLIEQDITPSVTDYDFRTLAGDGARQLLVKIPFLASQAEAHALLTYQVRTRVILPPDDPSQLVIPAKPPKALKRYLGKSPYIETNHSQLKRISRDLFAKLANAPDTEESDTEEPHAEESGTEESEPDEPDTDESVGKNSEPDTDEPVAEIIEAEPTATEPAAGESETVVPAASSQDSVSPPALRVVTDWERVEAIYDYVQSAIKYVPGDDKSALATLRDGEGDCQNISALFVALCRTNKIPARIVWVHEHNYAEFCLADAQGTLNWFPCESSGSRAFGEMPLARVILQKGDNFKVPEQKKALRYASDFGVGLPATSGGGKPAFKFVRKKM